MFNTELYEGKKLSSFKNIYEKMVLILMSRKDNKDDLAFKYCNRVTCLFKNVQEQV